MTVSSSDLTYTNASLLSFSGHQTALLQPSAFSTAVVAEIFRFFKYQYHTVKYLIQVKVPHSKAY